MDRPFRKYFTEFSLENLDQNDQKKVKSAVTSANLEELLIRDVIPTKRKILEQIKLELPSSAEVIEKAHHYFKKIVGRSARDIPIYFIDVKGRSELVKAGITAESALGGYYKSGDAIFLIVEHETSKGFSQDEIIDYMGILIHELVHAQQAGEFQIKVTANKRGEDLYINNDYHAEKFGFGQELAPQDRPGVGNLVEELAPDTIRWRAIKSMLSDLGLSSYPSDVTSHIRDPISLRICELGSKLDEIVRIKYPDIDLISLLLEVARTGEGEQELRQLLNEVMNDEEYYDKLLLGMYGDIDPRETVLEIKKQLRLVDRRLLQLLNSPKRS